MILRIWVSIVKVTAPISHKTKKMRLHPNEWRQHDNLLEYFLVPALNNLSNNDWNQD